MKIFAPERLPIRTRVLIYVIAIIGSFIILLGLISETILNIQFEDLGRIHITRDIELVHKLIKEETERLSQLNRDWGAWDETYEFIQNRNSKYKERNLIPENFSTMDIELIIYFGLNGDVVYGVRFDQEQNEISPPDEGLIKRILENLYNENLRQYLISGVITILDKEPYIISAESILTSTHKGPLKGWLVMGRRLNLKPIMDLTNLLIEVHTADSTKFCLLNFNPEEHILAITSASKDTLSAIHKFYDILNGQMIDVKVAEENGIVKQGKRVVIYITLLVLVFGIIIIILAAAKINTLILKPLSEISQQLKGIDLEKVGNKITLHSASAEFNELASVFNGMLTTISRQKEQILESEEKYRDLVENAAVGILIDDVDGNVVYFNDKFSRLFGYKQNEFAKLKPEDYIFPEDLKIIREYHRRRISGEDAPSRYEIRGIHKNKKLINLEVYTILLKKNGKIIGTRNYIMDITERKRVEDHLSYQSMTDELTGLLNRRGFKSLAQHQIELAKKIKKGFYLFYCDLNDMKKINDRFGHNTGDKALRDIANILRSSFRKTDIIARVGGDEFIILAPEAMPESLNVMLNRLNANIDKYNLSSNSFKISLSIGYVYFNPDDARTLEQIMEAADKMMYQEKIRFKNKGG
uniref:Diguanylate cyclase n=1 Tax=candidate division WOR-3 bacterium TaxID=2052148 RepID=A0A7V3RIB9_UNCW3